MTDDDEQATADDPLRPLLLHMLRSTLTPDTERQVDQETAAMDALVSGLTQSDIARLMHLAVAVLDMATPGALGVLNGSLRDIGSPLRLALTRGQGRAPVVPS